MTLSRKEKCVIRMKQMQILNEITVGFHLLSKIEVKQSRIICTLWCTLCWTRMAVTFHLMLLLFPYFLQLCCEPLYKFQFQARNGIPAL